MKQEAFKVFALSIGTLLLLCVISVTHAKIPSNKTIVTFSGGVAFPTELGSPQTIYIGQSYYAYSAASNKRNYNGVYGVMIGKELASNPNFAWQLGLSYYYTQMTAKGTVNQGITVPSSDTFPYQFDLLNQQLLVEAKLLLTTLPDIYPYLSMGVGGSFNSAKSYKVDYPIFLTFTPKFRWYNETSLAYTFGVGMDANVYRNVRFGVNYRYRRFGSAHTDSGYIDTVPFSDHLTQSNIYTYEILAQITLILE